MIQFRIFGIPVTVEPWFWVTSALLGRALSIKDKIDLMQTLMWIVVVFVSILAHELGHALTSRKLASRSNPYIRLTGFGGLAYPNTKLTNTEHRKVSIAGPAAGFLVTLVVIIFLAINYGGSNAIAITKMFLFNISPGDNVLNAGFLKFITANWALKSLIYSLFWVNFWWSIVNLLPVTPLDGGHIYATFESSERKIYKVGMITAIAVACVFLYFGLFFAAALFGYLAYQNYQALQKFIKWR